MPRWASIRRSPRSSSRCATPRDEPMNDNGPMLSHRAVVLSALPREVSVVRARIGAGQGSGLAFFFGRQVDRGAIDLGVVGGEFGAGAADHRAVQRVTLA